MKSKVLAGGESFVNNPPVYDWKFENCSIVTRSDQQSCKVSLYEKASEGVDWRGLEGTSHFTLDVIH